ncbi:MAG TPA: hypothetical protein VMW48_14195 [Vicinamibacterales bacterium]|nr:hypothetical protein [Vicinamibacterales bacterium]
MHRRTLLHTALALLTWRPSRRLAAAQAPFGEAHLARVTALAAVVLPSALGAAGQGRAVADFMGWVRDYRAGAERDHGYGVPNLRTLPPFPVADYVAQLDDLDRRAGGSLISADATARQRAVSEAIAAANVRDLPARPTGAHIATDLMSRYFHGPAANDRAYGRAIGRDACRGLAGSDARPAELPSTERP